MFCTNCGNNLEVEDNFCGRCGTAVRRADPANTVRPPVKVVGPTVPRPAIDRQPEYTPPIAPPHTKSVEVKSEKEKEKLRADLKVLLEKKQGREITEQELSDTEHWLRRWAEIAYDSYMEDKRREKKLEANPKGFHLEGQGYSCFICGASVSNEQTWYDKYGIKCLTCQSAINKKLIPATAASNKDSWYSAFDLEHHFFVNRFGIRRWVKEGLLKPRTVPGSGGGTHCQLFFIKDHADILPPKNLVEWPTVKTQKDGEERYHSEPWFLHFNPAEVLKGYKILEYLQGLKEKETVKSYPQLSSQIPQGARLVMKINYIGQAEGEK
mgnify:CR=1 FL=1